MKLTRFSVVLLVTWALSVAIAFGQAKGTSKGQTKTVTGCLEKSDEAGEFRITENGKSYDLRSSTIKLADHVGHKVTVRGRFKPVSEENEANEREENERKQTNEAGDIRVTNLKMVSTSCH